MYSRCLGAKYPHDKTKTAEITITKLGTGDLWTVGIVLLMSEWTIGVVDSGGCVREPGNDSCDL